MSNKAMHWLRVLAFCVIAGVLLACAALSFYSTVVISERNPPPCVSIECSYQDTDNCQRCVMH